jgi:hypothetical protein
MTQITFMLHYLSINNWKWGLVRAIYNISSDSQWMRRQEDNNRVEQCSKTLRQNKTTIQRYSQIFLMNEAHSDLQKITKFGLIVVGAVTGQDVSIMCEVIWIFDTTFTRAAKTFEPVTKDLKYQESLS